MKDPIYLFIFGTRPECIKVSPLILEAAQRNLNYHICFTGQHKEMVTPLLELFQIQPNFNLDIMKPNQTLMDISLEIMTKLKPILLSLKPTHIIIQGDTTTAAVAAMMGFYEKIQIVHIEAGLRTYNLNSPWPEEFNRRLIALTAQWHFTPTQQASNHLLNEMVNPKTIHMVGNTGIDALRITSELIKEKFVDMPLDTSSEFKILVTLHRRESFGIELESVMMALKQIVDAFPHVLLRWPMHQNPRVRAAFEKIFVDGQHPRIKLMSPLGYKEFIEEMILSDLIVTDSGGVQEEAPFLGKPILVCRKNTERPEAVSCGAAKLVGTDQVDVFNAIKSLIHKPESYYTMAQKREPFGDGFSSAKIFDILTTAEKV